MAERLTAEALAEFSEPCSEHGRRCCREWPVAALGNEVRRLLAENAALKEQRRRWAGWIDKAAEETHETLGRCTIPCVPEEARAAIAKEADRG